MNKQQRAISYTNIGGDLDWGLGEEVGALAPKIFFCRLPQNVTFGGDGGGPTVFVNFNI